jgi:hypothetical protein
VILEHILYYGHAKDDSKLFEKGQTLNDLIMNFKTLDKDRNGIINHKKKSITF